MISDQQRRALERYAAARRDALRTARGVMIGTLVSSVAWIAGILAVVALTR